MTTCAGNSLCAYLRDLEPLAALLVVDREVQARAEHVLVVLAVDAVAHEGAPAGLGTVLARTATGLSTLCQHMTGIGVVPFLIPLLGYWPSWAHNQRTEGTSGSLFKHCSLADALAELWRDQMKA